MERLKTILTILGIWAIFAGLAYILRFLLVLAWAVFAFATGGFISIVLGNDSLYDAMLSVDENGLWYGYLFISGIFAIYELKNAIIKGETNGYNGTKTPWHIKRRMGVALIGEVDKLNRKYNDRKILSEETKKLKDKWLKENKIKQPLRQQLVSENFFYTEL